MQLIQGRGSRRFLLGLLALFAVSSAAWADVPSSPPPSWIYDGAHLLQPAELSELATLKTQLEEQTGARLVVLTLAESGGRSPKSIAVDTLNEWNAGTQSALLLVMLSPRELYIQPGTELAPVLDSSTSSSICSGVIAPKMRGGDRAGAIRAGLEAIASRITSAANAAPGVSTPTVPSNSESLSTTGSTSPPSEGHHRSEITVPSWLPGGGMTLFVLMVGGCAVAVLGFFWTITFGLKRLISALERLFARKCPECSEPMAKRTHVNVAPTYTSTGEGTRVFECGACGHFMSEPYIIAQLVESTSSSSDSSWSSSDSSWSSSSSDSSWSSSDSSSSSSSSSDGSGGGGSSW